MIPIHFKEANTRFGPPPDLQESQCMTIPAHVTKAIGGSVDGSQMVIVAWQPDDDELKRLNEGHPIFLSMLGSLAPHFLTTSFEQATKPA